MIRSLPAVTVSCPSCRAQFPVDPAKVPDEGIHVICSECQRVFRIEPSPLDSEDVTAPPPDASGPQDPATAPTDLDASEADPDPFADIDAPTANTSESRSAPAAEEVRPEPEEQPFEDLRSLASEALAEPVVEDGPGDSEAGRSTLSSGRERFGQRDPHDRARHLARVLVSDIIAYHPARYHESYARGTLKEDFEEEVKKSWKEYVDQVGEELAESTPYFDEALNEVLGKGEEVF
ncbi:MAG: zinc-ribbon domain-containing protein [Gemmatimonadota bacterium]